jgi:hypothetical protein
MAEIGEGRTPQVWQPLDWQGHAPEHVEGAGSKEQMKVCRAGRRRSRKHREFEAVSENIRKP